MRRVVALSVVLLAGLLWAEPLEAAPPQLSLLVMLKVVTYDTGFAGRGEGEFLVLVPHHPSQEKQLKEAVEAVKSMAQSRIQNRVLRFEGVSEEKLALKAKEQKPSAILLLGGATELQLKETARLSASDKLYTLTLDPSLVSSKVALGVVNNAGKPQVAVNLAIAKEIGLSLPMSVLKIARTYGGQK